MNLLQHVGKVRGSFKTKEHRAAKLIAQWDDLTAKLERMVVKGRGQTEQARHAYAVLTIMETGIRVGNEGSAEGWISENQRLALKDDPERVNPFSGVKGIKEGDVIWRSPHYGQMVKTFGLTTLLHEHVEVKRDRLLLSFTGKKMVNQELVITNSVLIRFAPKMWGKRPGDRWLGVEYGSLKRFVRRFVGQGFTPKDLRTAKVNLLFVQLWEAGYAPAFEAATRKADRKRLLSEAIGETAERIGHTKGVCKSSYLSGSLLRHLLDAMDAEKRAQEEQKRIARKTVTLFD